SAVNTILRTSIHRSHGATKSSCEARSDSQFGSSSSARNAISRIDASTTSINGVPLAPFANLVRGDPPIILSDFRAQRLKPFQGMRAFGESWHRDQPRNRSTATRQRHARTRLDFAD